MEEENSKKKEEKTEGVADSILKGIGNIIPGLGNLLKGLEELPAFKERLEEIEKEVELRFKEEPLKRTSERTTVSRRWTSRTPSTLKKATPPETIQERPVDIFDEGDSIKVIAEIPGVEEKDIKVDLQDDTLSLSVDIPGRKYHKDLRLPVKPEGNLEKTYKNGILEVKINK